MFRRATLLDEAHKLDDFDRGEPGLNDYLEDRAMGNQDEGYARTYVIANSDFGVVGYCSLCSSMISRANAPRQSAGHGAPNDIPVVHLARLAVDKDHQGAGPGAELLKYALQTTLLYAEKIGVRAMLVHAKNESAASFYGRYKFRAARNLERAMLCSVKDIAASLAVAKLEN